MTELLLSSNPIVNSICNSLLRHTNDVIFILANYKESVNCSSRALNSNSYSREIIVEALNVLKRNSISYSLHRVNSDMKFLKSTNLMIKINRI